MAYSQKNILDYIDRLLYSKMTEIENSCLVGDGVTEDVTVASAEEQGYYECPHRVLTYKYGDGYVIYVQIHNAYTGPYHLTVVLNDDEGHTVKVTQMGLAEFLNTATTGKDVLRNHTLNKYDYEQGRYVRPKNIYPVN